MPKTFEYLPRDYSHEPRLPRAAPHYSELASFDFVGTYPSLPGKLCQDPAARSCRFYPSCSHYGYQAIYKYGVLKGGSMAIWRVLRCNPFNPGGYDPVH